MTMRKMTTYTVWYTTGMTKLLEDAVEVLRSLPENIQATAARAIINYGSSYDESLQLSDDQIAEGALNAVSYSSASAVSRFFAEINGIAL